MFHVDNCTYALLAAAALAGIQDGGGVDEIQASGLYFCFDIEASESSEIVFTGVDFMGHKESYIETTYEIENIAFLGAYDDEGEEITTDFDPVRLAAFL